MFIKRHSVSVNVHAHVQWAKLKMLFVAKWRWLTVEQMSRKGGSFVRSIIIAIWRLQVSFTFRFDCKTIINSNYWITQVNTRRTKISRLFCFSRLSKSSRMTFKHTILWNGHTFFKSFFSYFTDDQFFNFKSKRNRHWEFSSSLLFHMLINDSRKHNTKHTIPQFHNSNIHLRNK